MSEINLARKHLFFRIDRGICQFNHDYYAALGLPIHDDLSSMRPTYLRIARLLHPDVCMRPPEEKDLATQYFAKLVNPAYNALSKPQEHNAYQSIFKLLAKRLMQRTRNVTIYSEVGCKFLLNPSELAYDLAVAVIAKRQYDDLDKIVDYTAQLSELNLIYILFREGYRYGTPNTPPVLIPIQDRHNLKVNPAPQPAPPAPLPPQIPPSKPPSISDIGDIGGDATCLQFKVSPPPLPSPSSSPPPPLSKSVADRFKLAENYMSQQQWQLALDELQQLTSLEPSNSKYFALLGVVYENINQSYMAKMYFQRSLELDPQNPIALEHSQANKSVKKTNSDRHSKTSRSDSKPTSKSSKSSTKSSTKPNQDQRSWFFRLFGFFKDK